MVTLIESEVSTFLAGYFSSKGLQSLGKFNAFDHEDDLGERSFEIDLAIGPLGTKGNRTGKQKDADQTLFEEHSSKLDSVVKDLNKLSLFPGTKTSIMSWSYQPNPNPLVGIAIEIENSPTKYLLGSILASAIAGRWGIIVIPESPIANRWVQTLERMMHKGAQSPVPSNISLFSWPKLKQGLTSASSQ